MAMVSAVCPLTQMGVNTHWYSKAQLTATHTGRETTAVASTKSASKSRQQAQKEPHAIQ